MAFKPEAVFELIERVRSGDIEIPDEGRFVNAYEITQAYGGPEEGGWWYYVHEPIESIRVTNPMQAQVAALYLKRKHGEDYADRRECTSAAGGEDLQICIEHFEAEFSPTERPHYE